MHAINTNYKESSDTYERNTCIDYDCINQPCLLSLYTCPLHVFLDIVMQFRENDSTSSNFYKCDLAYPPYLDHYEKIGGVNVNANVKAWTAIASMCIAQWSGVDVRSVPIFYSEASWTGMLDFHSGKWDEECMVLVYGSFAKGVS